MIKTTSVHAGSFSKQSAPCNERRASNKNTPTMGGVFLYDVPCLADRSNVLGRNVAGFFELRRYEVDSGVRQEGNDDTDDGI